MTTPRSPSLTLEPSTPPEQDGMARAIEAFDALASDPTWMARPLADFPPEAHPFNAAEMIFYQGGRKLGARVAGASETDRAVIARECHDALQELISQLRERVAMDPRVESLAAQTAPWATGANLLIEASGACFIAGFLEGGLMRESQQDESLGFGREMDAQWREAEQTLCRTDTEDVRALAAAESESSRSLSTFLAGALPEDARFNAGAQIGLFGHVASCPRYPRELPVMRSMNRHYLGRLFQSSAIAIRLAERSGAELGPLMNSGMLQDESWERFTQLLGGFPSKPLMLAEAKASLAALGALSEAQQIASATGPAARASSAPLF